MKKETTKEKILLAALTLFSKKGYDGVGIDLIAETVGIKGPSIYSHFSSKEDIFNSLIEMIESHYNKHFGSKDNIPNIPETLDELYAFCIQRIEFTVQDPKIKKIRKFCTMEQFRNSKMAKFTSKHSLDGIVEMFSSVLKKLIEKKVIKHDDPDFLAFQIVAPTIPLIQRIDREPKRKEETIDLIKKHIKACIETISYTK